MDLLFRRVRCVSPTDGRNPVATPGDAWALKYAAQDITNFLVLRGHTIRRFRFNNRYEVDLPDGSIKRLINRRDFVAWGQQQLDLAFGSDPISQDADRSDVRNKTPESAQAITAELRATLVAREHTISDLREKGKRIVADRDRWEAAARRYETEIAALKSGAKGDRAPDIDGRLFRELKNALAKMFHPDALRSASNFERVVREELYKEINAQIGRIEGRRQSR
jgi:hypothetical protein